MESSGYSERSLDLNEVKTSSNHSVYLLLFLAENAFTIMPLLVVVTALLIKVLFDLSFLELLIICIFVPITSILTAISSIVLLSRKDDSSVFTDWDEYFTLKDTAIALKYMDRKMSLELFIEMYMNEKIEFKVDPLLVFWKRYDLFRMNISFKFIVEFLALKLWGTNSTDNRSAKDIKENSFYRYFLGPRMLFSSAIFESEDETLEAAQDRKLDLICKKLQMKPGYKHLDIGSSYGTLLCHAAKYFGTTSTGITLSHSHREWSMSQAKEIYDCADDVSVLVLNYKVIPKAQYDVITCLEMTQYIGVREFQNFLLQVYDLLADDGLFYLQISSTRRNWQFEDVLWNLFTGSYINTKASASLTLGWITTQAERAGFEVHSVENVGMHYSITLNKWYQNWLSNKKEVVQRYGEWMYRLMIIYFSWATTISSQGNSSVYCIVLHKNTSRMERKMFVGDYPVAMQQ